MENLETQFDRAFGTELTEKQRLIRFFLLNYAEKNEEFSRRVRLLESVIVERAIADLR